MMVFEDASAIGFSHNTPAPANYFDWVAQNHVFTDMAATQNAPQEHHRRWNASYSLRTRLVTPSFFSVLGVRPLLGRTFTEEEDRNAAQVVVIAYSLWPSACRGRPSELDQPILLNDSKYSVIGVMPRDFVYRDHDRDIWVPIHITPEFRAQRGSHYLSVVARLKPDATLQRASDEMAAIAHRLQQQYPNENRYTGAVVVPIKEDLLGKDRRQRLNHAVEAFAEILNLVAGGAYLDRLETALAHRDDSRLQQGQRTRQKAHGEARDGPRHQTHHAAQHQSLSQVEGVLANVPQHDGPHHPQHQHCGKNGELRR